LSALKLSAVIGTAHQITRLPICIVSGVYGSDHSAIGALSPTKESIPPMEGFQKVYNAWSPLLKIKKINYEYLEKKVFSNI